MLGLAICDLVIFFKIYICYTFIPINFGIENTTSQSKHLYPSQGSGHFVTIFDNIETITIVGKIENAWNQTVCFSYNVFYPSQTKFEFFIHIY